MEKKSKVFMISGISGSGKTFFSKELELLGVPRISMDEELWPDYYVYPGLFSDEHLDFLYRQATERIFAKIRNFCAEGRSCSVDMPFCKASQRENFRAQIENCGGEPVLIWINTDLAVLKQRLSDRAGKNGPNNLPVSEAEINMYWNGFQKPVGESHIEIDGNKPFDFEEILKMI
ncbi:MAG: ATP-binding protein [Ruminococcaceae bacterium]|nr:ATP-binding protein [Oscillospiraceae bacterium]